MPQRGFEPQGVPPTQGYSLSRITYCEPYGVYQARHLPGMFYRNVLDALNVYSPLCIYAFAPQAFEISHKVGRNATPIKICSSRLFLYIACPAGRVL